MIGDHMCNLRVLHTTLSDIPYGELKGSRIPKNITSAKRNDENFPRNSNHHPRSNDRRLQQRRRPHRPTRPGQPRSKPSDHQPHPNRQQRQQNHRCPAEHELDKTRDRQSQTKLINPTPGVSKTSGVSPNPTPYSLFPNSDDYYCSESAPPPTATSPATSYKTNNSLASK
jgi:hypothetical protein